MAILLTGAAGFIGDHFSAMHDYFPSRGVRLVGVDKVSQPPVHLDTSDYVQIDLTSVKEVVDLFLKVNPQTVVHLAGASRVGEESDINVEILKNLLYAANMLSQRPHFVFAGSAAEYGDLSLEKDPFTEKDDLNPVDPYAFSKVKCHVTAMDWASIFNSKITWFCFANVYGPGQDPDKLYHFVPSAIDSVYRGKPIVLNSNGLSRRQFVYVDDISRALWLAVCREISGVFNLGGIELPMKDAAQIIVTAVHDVLLRHGVMPIPAVFDLRPEGGGAMRVAVDSTKAATELGWTPLVGIYDGIHRTVISRLQKDLRSES